MCNTTGVCDNIHNVVLTFIVTDTERARKQQKIDGIATVSGSKKTSLLHSMYSAQEMPSQGKRSEETLLCNVCC